MGHTWVLCAQQKSKRDRKHAMRKGVGGGEGSRQREKKGREEQTERKNREEGTKLGGGIRRRGAPGFEEKVGTKGLDGGRRCPGSKADVFQL